MADDQDLEQEQQEDTSSPEIIAQAREMGHRPRTEFKGDPEKWVDAKTFLDRGEHVLPIVKANADRLRKENAALHSRQNELEAAVTASQETMKALEKYHQDDVKQKVDAARAKLKAELVAAKKEGNVEAEVELTDELGKLNAAVDISTAIDSDDKKIVKRDTKDYTKEPEFIAWTEDNEWFGKDKARTAIAYQVAMEIKQENPNLKGRAYLDRVTEETNKEVTRLGGGRSAPQRKVEGGKGGAGGNNGGNGGGKTYADLPADAKKACDSFEKDLVGPNRRYKDRTEWRASYVKQHFTEV